ncbi:MAG: hypothetical protein NC453_11485 [Muribaculum sp.]|nr:hypothetical protein [Muribaculum sp.]
MYRPKLTDIHNASELLESANPITDSKERAKSKEETQLPDPSDDVKSEFVRLIHHQSTVDYVSIESFGEKMKRLGELALGYDWNDIEVEDEDGRKGLMSQLGETILPCVFHGIAERYPSSLKVEYLFVPVIDKFGKCALVSTGDTSVLGTPFEYDDIFLLPFTTDRFAVRKGDKWGLLQAFRDGLLRGLKVLSQTDLDAIYPSFDFESWVYPVVKEGMFGFLDKFGFTPAKYDDFNIAGKDTIELIKDNKVVETLNNGLPY